MRRGAHRIGGTTFYYAFLQIELRSQINPSPKSHKAKQNFFKEIREKTDQRAESGETAPADINDMMVSKFSRRNWHNLPSFTSKTKLRVLLAQLADNIVMVARKRPFHSW